MSEQGWRLATGGLVALVLLIQAPAATAQEDLAQSTLRRAVLTLPAGMTVSPGAANGLVACPDERLNFNRNEPATCPDASKIGTVEIETPPVPGGLTGSVHVRPSTPERLFRIVLTASSPLRGVHVKLPGEIELDPVSGQVSAVFDELPQLPFSALRVRFFGGERAILTNPLDCGSYRVQGLFTPWSGTAPVGEGNLIQIGDGSCPRVLPFDPRLVAGTVSPVASAYTPLIFRVQREDGRQELERIDLRLPRGVTAKLAGVPLCDAAQAAAGTCGQGSRIGSVTVGAGAGAAPLYLRGDAYLTGAYGGARFGLSIVVPAVAGPFDLGTVVVRAAVHVDPKTAQLRVLSDPLPRIVRGVVLRLRDMHLAIDRDRFMRNPSSCRRMQVRATITAVQGGSASPSVPFQAGSCAALRFAPRFSVALTGRGRVGEGRRPGLVATVRARGGDANLKRVAFTLPPEIAFDARRGGPRMCTRAQLAARACPRASTVGRARAITPLLDRPLRGPVYFVRGVKGDIFPKLAMALDGQLQIDLLGDTSVKQRGLRTTFGELPDVPLRAFTLRLAPGLLTPTKPLCGRRPRSSLAMQAQNGRELERRVRVGLPCGR